MTLEEALRSDSSIYRFNLFLDALCRASTREKAEALKRVYLAFDGDPRKSGVEFDDVYFEIIGILGELSDREINLLFLIDKYYKLKTKENDGKSGFSANQDGSIINVSYFYSHLGSVVGVTPGVARGLIKRLERTGLIETDGVNSNPYFQEYRPSDLYKEVMRDIYYAIESSYTCHGNE